MPRYVSRPVKAWWGEDDWSAYEDQPNSMEVLASNDEPKFTGLLDKDGNPIYRAPEKIGFV